MLPIYIVSLEQDIERREKIKIILDKLQIPFEFVNAVYGKELSTGFVNQLNPSGKLLKRKSKPSLGEIGCTLSHLKVYELMLERKQDWVCIFEDDIIIDERIKDFYKNINNEIHKLNQNNLYLLGGQNGIYASQLITKSFFSYLQIGHQKFHKTINSQKYIFRTCCYLMSIEIAKKILDLSKDRFLLADDWEFFKNKNIISEIHLADFIEHPTDLTDSHIEKERKKTNTSSKLSTLLLNKTKFRLRLLISQINRFRR